jgi:soluble lytic murein transglycosylase
LEQVRDYGPTGGLLPKVIMGYNAGPGMLDEWNVRVKGGEDPLLFMESIPYWETRGYAVTVLRNYWMYQRNAGQKSPSLSAMAQGMWPRFPGLPGAPVQTADAGSVLPGTN